MIQTSLQYSNKPLDLLIDYLDNYTEIVDTEFNAAYDLVEPLLLEDLKQDIPPVSYPIEWESERQRLAFWATDGFGGGIPHQRTDAMKNAFVVTKEGGGLLILVKVKNPSPGVQFVYGSLSLSNRGGYQQKMHKNTGYPVAGDIVDYWLAALTEQFVLNMNNRLGDMVGKTTTNRRAYATTKPRYQPNG